MREYVHLSVDHAQTIAQPVGRVLEFVTRIHPDAPPLQAMLVGEWGQGAQLLVYFPGFNTPMGPWEAAKCRMLALGIICVSCASVWPYNDLRAKATPRIIATRSPDFAPLIQEQTQRRKDWSWPYYTMALLSLGTLAASRSPKSRPALFAVVIFGALLFWFSIWMHKKECEVYHRNIVRFVPVR